METTADTTGLAASGLSEGHQPLAARRCKCAQPLIDDDSCLVCGRLIASADPRVRMRLSWTRTPDGWTRRSVVRAVKAFTFFRDRPPTESDWRQRGSGEWPTVATVRALFGSFDCALAAAGIEQDGNSG